MEIIPDTVCIVCCHWGYITLQCSVMVNLRYQLCAGSYTSKCDKCGLVLCSGRMSRRSTYPAAKCINSRKSHHTTSVICPIENQQSFSQSLDERKRRTMKQEEQQECEEMEEDEKD